VRVNYVILTGGIMTNIAGAINPSRPLIEKKECDGTLAGGNY